MRTICKPIAMEKDAMKTLNDLDEKLKPLMAVLAEMPIHHTWNVLKLLSEVYVGNLPDAPDAMTSKDRVRQHLASAIVELGR